jgi:hypothetical protein
MNDVIEKDTINILEDGREKSNDHRVASAVKNVKKQSRQFSV